MSRPRALSCSSDEENTAECASPNRTPCHCPHYCSQGRQSCSHQLADYSVGEMPPELIRQIAEHLNLQNNAGAIQLADVLGFNFANVNDFQKHPSVAWALFEKCHSKGFRMDQITEALEAIESVSVLIIRKNLNEIHQFVRSKRARMSTHTLCDPQQNTESSSSLSDSLPSSQFTCHCEDNQSLVSECYVDTRRTADSPRPKSRLNNNNYPVNPNGNRRRVQPLSQNPASLQSDYEQSTSLKMPCPDSSTHPIAAGAANPNVFEKPPDYNRIRLTTPNTQSMMISNPSSDEESCDEFSKKRYKTRRPRVAHIFITGGNSLEEMENIERSLQPLNGLPYKLIWDSPKLNGKEWEHTFQKATIVLLGLTRDFAANIGSGRQWPSRATRINEYVQRELINNSSKNTRFISVVFSKSGLKKADLSFELYRTPYRWPDQGELLMQRLTEKMDKKLQL